MNRRELITLLGSAAAWPLAARAQQDGRMRRIGVLAPLGWTEGRNARIDLRWAGGDTNRLRSLAQELVGLQPDIILTNTTPATVAFQREAQTIPIVFVAAEPVA